MTNQARSTFIGYTERSSPWTPRSSNNFIKELVGNNILKLLGLGSHAYVFVSMSSAGDSWCEDMLTKT